MKNKKGFTIIELGVSICLITVVSFLLFQMITTIKKVYTASDVKTVLLTKQAIMTQKIYDEFEQKSISEITTCDQWQISCLKFVFSDGSASTLLVDPLKHTISYNNYIVDYEEIDDTISFGELVFNKRDSFFTIKIPITSKSVEGNYGISFTQQHTNYVVDTYTQYIVNNGNIIIPISDIDGSQIVTTITNDGNDYWMRVYDATANPMLSTVIVPYFKHLKLETCSNTTFVGNVYELKTGNNTSRWCQTNNVYTQNVGDYKHISGFLHTALGKDTYKYALNTNTVLESDTLDVKVNNFMDRYTFKLR